MRKSILLASALMLLMACGGKKTSGDDAAVADSTNVQATAVADSVATVADDATDDEDTIDELVFAPDLKSDKPLDLSDGKDEAAKYFPVWDEDIVYDEDCPPMTDEQLRQFKRVHPRPEHIGSDRKLG